MSIQIHTHLDPAVEVIMILERICSDGSIPGSLEDAISWYSEKFCIPVQELDPLVRPMMPMETELLELVRNRKDLWDGMFYPNSKSESLMAWSFFFLEHQGQLDFRELDLRRRLIALSLNCPLSQLDSVQDLEGLMHFLSAYHCSDQTKWTCAMLWQEPEAFYRRYRELVDKAAPVVAKYDPLLQPLISRTVQGAMATLKADPKAILDQLGTTLDKPLDSAIIYPIANNFNGLGILWDHTSPQSPTYLMVGILRDDIHELLSRYRDNAEFLTDRLKSLSDQRRIEILKALKNSPMYGQELADLLSLSPATISHHMSTLVSAGFVSVDRKGARTSYTIHRQNLDGFLKNLRTTLL